MPGVLDKSKADPRTVVNDARRLIADGTISGGMIPKVETCIYALEQGVEGVVILDGKCRTRCCSSSSPTTALGTLIHK